MNRNPRKGDLMCWAGIHETVVIAPRPIFMLAALVLHCRGNGATLGRLVVWEAVCGNVH